MAKEETASGLLSKMVKFVRNPATSWTDLDAASADRDEAISKQLLKEMIERKRQNDFVRKREFEMLRKMRKREAIVGLGQDEGGRPSFFQSSLPSRPDDRASTIKKIDEIEAQMSMQWWKTKNNPSIDPSISAFPSSRAHDRGEVTLPPLQDGELPSAYRATVPAGLQSAASKIAPSLQAQARFPIEATALSMALAASSSGKAIHRISESGNFPSGRDSGPSTFSPSKISAVDAQEIVAHDAELEEAAIRFANGDDEGAEAGLLEILAPGAARAGHVETWLTLFDLYRATGEQEKFEAAALQFVERFERSAPQWFSMPELVKLLARPASKSAQGPAADWICPSTLGLQTVAALTAVMVRAPQPWRLDWSNLKTIEPAAVEALSKVFNGWGSRIVELHFVGAGQLQKVLQQATPSGNRDADQHGWQLRMQALRVMHRSDDFELAALDFCVTYEVSPPAWESARCKYRSIDAPSGAEGDQTIIGEIYRDSTSFGPSTLGGGDTQHGEAQSSLMGSMASVASVELSGQIQGDVIAVLDKLEIKLIGAEIMLISCGKLIRVDFSAAGTLLNWVSARENQHRSVQFTDVNRLVAAFFNVIGITDHAQVVVRVN
jgi:ABC-type transporter Mla MlaB component